MLRKITQLNLSTIVNKPQIRPLVNVNVNKAFYSTTNSSNNDKLSSPNLDNSDNNKDNDGNKSHKNKSKAKYYLPLALGATALLAYYSQYLFDQPLNDNEQIENLTRLPKKENGKQRVIVLGTGWSSLAFINSIDMKKYEVIVVSPRNYFLFTPMLTAATVGSVEVRSIIEPIRKVLHRLARGSNTAYIEAECTDIDHENNTITIKAGGGNLTASIPYHKLVVAIGAVPSSFGTKGVDENCTFIKEATDASAIRKKIMNCFENANFPGHTEEELRQLLNFVIVGGGPSGVELGGELYDFLQDDLSVAYPRLAKYAKITLIQSANHLLNTYDSKIIDFTEKQFGRSGINTMVNTRVIEVLPDKVVCLKKPDTNPTNPAKDPPAKAEPLLIPYGVCIWATGVSQRPLISKFVEKIPEQKNQRAVKTDVTLKVVGVKNENIFAIGDCSTISQDILMKKITDIFIEGDTNKDNQLSKEELKVLFTNHLKDYPQLKSYINGLDHYFEDFDISKDGYLQLNEFKNLMIAIDNNLTTLPATAQVANQQGAYLAKEFNRSEGEQHEPFKYKHLGSFAYIGHKNAVADIPGFAGGGIGVWWMWRSIYLNKQFSWKNKFLVSVDWVKSILFGRDISNA
ncbi:hypothetical protein CYY_007187 [Polysphondylium violaceum]|uniref:EF-hand domain-containing protein n=1 Tax=Polysphondylium violaceum TaxID=133409 RepID=A0A8J4V2G2_9MYCE|nr:hypothetical protein CYY_007187 [Polysphondylium violaceum]